PLPDLVLGLAVHIFLPSFYSSIAVNLLFCEKSWGIRLFFFVHMCYNSKKPTRRNPLCPEPATKPNSLWIMSTILSRRTAILPLSGKLGPQWVCVPPPPSATTSRRCRIRD